MRLPLADAGPASVDVRAYVRTAFVLAWRPTRANALHWLSWAIALGIEVGALFALRGGHIYGWERQIAEALQQLPRREAVFAVSNYATNTLAPHFLVFFVCVVAAFLIARRWAAAWLVALTFPLHVLAQFPKALVDRPRPSQYFDGAGGFQSFPSGHAEFVVTFYGLMVFLAWRRVPSRLLRVAIVVAWLVLAAAVGVGRVATERHWPIDILVSYVVGLGLLSGLIWVDRALRGARAQRER